jgi:hypothetical protein
MPTPAFDRDESLKAIGPRPDFSDPEARGEWFGRLACIDRSARLLSRLHEASRRDLMMFLTVVVPPVLPDVPPALWFADRRIVVSIERWSRFDARDRERAELKAEILAELKNTPGVAGPKMTKAEANLRVREILKKHPTWGVRQVAADAGCSRSLVAETDAWKAVQRAREAGRKPREQTADPAVLDSLIAESNADRRSEERRPLRRPRLAM